MTKAIVVHETGGPEVLSYEDFEPGAPGDDELRVEHRAIGVNFIDIYFRKGMYPAPNGLPFVPGNEGAGTVSAVGRNVTEFKPGDRVAYIGPIGSYSAERNIAADRVVRLPDEISFSDAAAIMLKGITVWYLATRTHHIKPGDTVLYHAAAGGVGLLFGQWAKHLGAKVIGTASGPEKIELAKQHGYDHVINYREADFVESVREITGGKRCDVVYDSVGKNTYPGSLDCLRPFGLFVSFGQSSGAIEGFSLAHLAQRGSLYATRPTIFTHIARREDLLQAAGDLFDLVAKGILRVRIEQSRHLRDAARVHEALEAGKTTGTTILTP